jgi:UDP-N-acetyl-D-glucosamine dehydrogenase
VPLTEDLLKSVDAVVISTAHKNVDYGFVVKHAKLVIDTRNATRDTKRDDKVILMGGGHVMNT